MTSDIIQIDERVRAAVKTAVEKQMQEWGFASWYESWNHFSLNAQAIPPGALDVYKHNWKEVEKYFNKVMESQKRLDTSFMNPIIALRIDDLHRTYDQFPGHAHRMPDRYPPERVKEAEEKAARDRPKLLKDICLRDMEELQDTLALALTRVAIRAAVRELKNHGQNLSVVG